MIEKELLKQILSDQRESLQNRASGVRRDALSRIVEKKHLPHVVVLTGMRRSGKSTLLKQVISHLYSDKSFYYLSFEDERLASVRSSEFNKIYEALLELFGSAKTFFIDEIQNVPQFENFVRRFHDNGYKFYITGSNAKLLSKEIGTKLTGRHVDIEVKPFNFTEFLAAKGKEFTSHDVYITAKKVEIKKMFYDFLSRGGLPEAIIFGDTEIPQGIYDDIVTRDIISRYSVNDVKRIKELYRYLLTNCGQKFSYNSLKNSLNYGSGNTVRNHIHYLEETYLIRVIEQFDYSMKKQLRNDKKAYVVDNGIQKKVTTKISEDKGWMLENYFVNVIPSNKELWYFSRQTECDFIFRGTDNRPTPVQVTWELTQVNKEREVKGLLNAMESLNVKGGYIFTYETEEQIRIEGKNIAIVPLWSWLITGNEF